MPEALGPAFYAASTIAPFKWVNIYATGARKVEQCDSATADQPFGLSPEGQKGPPGVTGSDTTVAAVAGDPILIVGPGRVGLSKAAESISCGDKVKTDGNGDSVKVGTTAATKYLVGGFAIEDASTGEYFQVFVWPHAVTFPA